MENSILEYLVYGLLTGFSEVVPVSALAHQYLFGFFTGFTESALLRLLVSIGALAAVIVSCGKRLMHIRRELKVASVPKKHRKRTPDMVAVSDARLVFAGVLPMILGLAASVFAWDFFTELLWVMLMLIITGVVVYLPQYFAGGNRDSMGMSPKDGVIFGIVSALSVIPGISRMGGLIFTGRIRGCSREYMLELGLIYVGAMLVGWILLQIILMLIGGVVISWMVILGGLLAMAAAFGGGMGGIYLMRFLAVKMDFSGFYYYCWGLAVLCFVYYLIL